MNPFDLNSSELLIWGIVVHLIADWPLQNDWMAKNKMLRWIFWNTIGKTDTGEKVSLGHSRWFIRHPAAYLHALTHFGLTTIVFGWLPALVLAIVHMIIDCRWPVERWSKFIGQTQPAPPETLARYPIMDIGLEVRVWTEQVFHIVCLAIAALLVGV